VRRRRKEKGVLELVSFTENKEVLSRKITKACHYSRERVNPDLELWCGEGAVFSSFCEFFSSAIFFEGGGGAGT